jgi:hypothetical protein
MRATITPQTTLQKIARRMPAITITPPSVIPAPPVAVLSAIDSSSIFVFATDNSHGGASPNAVEQRSVDVERKGGDDAALLSVLVVVDVEDLGGGAVGQ